MAPNETLPHARSLSYRILNVFTKGDDPCFGNPLCVFQDATGLSDKDRQDLARQLNLSETTFAPRAGRRHSQRPHLHPQLRDAVRRTPKTGHGIRRA